MLTARAGRPWNARLADFAQRGFSVSQSGRFMNQNAFAFFDTDQATAPPSRPTISPQGSRGQNPKMVPCTPAPRRTAPGTPTGVKKCGAIAFEPRHLTTRPRDVIHQRGVGATGAGPVTCHALRASSLAGGLRARTGPGWVGVEPSVSEASLRCRKDIELLRAAPVRAAVPILLGVAIVGATFLPAVLSVAAEEGEEAGSRLTGAALLLSPYVLFAFTGLRTRTAAWLALLATLAAGTVVGLSVAGSSSTGGLVFLWLLPLEWLLSLLASSGRGVAPAARTMPPGG